MGSRLAPEDGAGTRPYVAPSRPTAALDPEAALRLSEEEARRRGHAEGLEEGRRAACEQAQSRLEELAASIRSVASLRSQVVRRAEQDLLQLATKIAEAIVRERIAESPEVAVRALRAAIDELPRNEPLTVRCHPGEEAALAEWLAGPGESGCPHTIRPDGSFSPGGVLVESAAGEIDVRVETQLRVIEHELLSRS